MLAYSTQLIDDDDIAVVTKVLKSNLLAQGPEVAAFEDALCNYTDAKYAVAFNSATSALQGVYSVAGISHGDEIIIQHKSWLIVLFIIHRLFVPK